MRIKIINFIIILAYFLLVLALFNLQIINGTKFNMLSNKNSIRLFPQDGSRGKIFDRSGNIIIGNELVYDLMILPQDKNELGQTLTEVAKILGVSYKELRVKFKSSYDLSFLPVTVAKNLDIKKVIALEELKSQHNGVIIQPRPERYYPYAGLACHLIGYLSEIDRWRLTKLEPYGYETKDIVGFGGIEERYDYYLRQEEGGLSMEVDSRGAFVRVLGFKPPKNGRDIQLTLDLKIQQVVEDNLKDRRGSVVIMDPYTGEIIAMASSPGFSPASFVNGSKNVAGLFSNPEAPMINRAITGLYPAASVFKVIVASAALETGKINSGTHFFCPGKINVGNREFKCWNTHGSQNLTGAIAQSCDVFFYRTGLLTGAQTIHDYALKFGLSKPTGIDIPYEASGFVPDPIWSKIYKFRNWYDGDTANLSIGQGDLLVTPLQITRAMAVFANKGFLVTPYILKAVSGRDISRQQRRITKLALKDNTIEQIRRGLFHTISDPEGTGNILSITGISVAGKTGTAQVSRGQSHAWFAGFFPFKNPKFVICVFLEHGGSGQASCVLAKEILQGMIQGGLSRY